MTAAQGPQAEAQALMQAWAEAGDHTTVAAIRARAAELLVSPPARDAVALRDALRVHHPIMRSETGPFSGCRCGGVKLGQDVIQHVVDHLLAAVQDPDVGSADVRPPTTCSDRHVHPGSAGPVALFCEQVPGHAGPHVNARTYW